MTNKEYLRQAYRLDQKINSDIEEVARLREMAGIVTIHGQIAKSPRQVYIFIFMRKSLLSNKNVIKYGIFLTEVKLPKNSHI